jgi:hypothetical protein
LAPTLDKAARNFCDHLNRLLAKTITQQRLICVSAGSSMLLTFRQSGKPIRARVKTKFGPMRLNVGHVCQGVVGANSQVRLVTVEYRYTLSRGDEEEPVLRWEYVKDWPDSAKSRWCRHHLQGDIALHFGTDQVSLNNLHLPTGYVAIEEVIHFCIVDLGVKPLSPKWHATLNQSYKLFETAFASGTVAPEP